MRLLGTLVGMAFVCRVLLVGQNAISVEAQSYLSSALDVVQEHYLYRTKVDWADLRRQTTAQASGAQTPVDTYPAIRFALAKLGDHHSYLQLTPELTKQETTRQPKLADPSAMPAALVRKPSFPFPSPFRTRRVPEGGMVAGVSVPIAQVVVPQFASPDRREVDAYATSVQRVIGGLVPQHPCGWIVDLRGNGGGNVWAMRAGIGPLLGDGDDGATLEADGTRSVWFYENGRSGVRNDPHDPDYARTTDPPVKLDAAPPVAVLIDRETGSSGEGVAIAFRQRPETRFFGELTFGAATSTFPYPLRDGAQIYLVTGVMLDRKGADYLTGVAPDVEVLSEATISTNDPVIRAASQWLTQTGSCTAR